MAKLWVMGHEGLVLEQLQIVLDKALMLDKAPMALDRDLLDLGADRGQLDLSAADGMLVDHMQGLRAQMGLG